MPLTDPTSGQPLPDSAIQRVLFAADSVRVYQIPPLASSRGFAASSWTSQPHPTAREIFLARLRIVETSAGSQIKVDVVLEDGVSGDLFAAAPYTNAAVVQQALDSTRCLALRVQGDHGMKAILGLGFDDRSAALDFSIALGEARKILGMETSVISIPAPSAPINPTAHRPNSNVLPVVKARSSAPDEAGSRSPTQSADTDLRHDQDDITALFSIAPPPSAARKGRILNACASSSGVEANQIDEDDLEDEGFGEFQ